MNWNCGLLITLKLKSDSAKMIIEEHKLIRQASSSGVWAFFSLLLPDWWNQAEINKLKLNWRINISLPASFNFWFHSFQNQFRLNLFAGLIWMNFAKSELNWSCRHWNNPATFESIPQLISEVQLQLNQIN